MIIFNEDSSRFGGNYCEDKRTPFEKLREQNETLYYLFEDAVKKILSKNHDYAGDGDFYQNFRDSEEIGIEPFKAIWLRFGDKRRRIVNFIKKEYYEVKDESFIDSCIDGANYILLMAAAWLDMRHFTRKADENESQVE